MSTRRDFVAGGALAAASLASPDSNSVLAAENQQNSMTEQTHAMALNPLTVFDNAVYAFNIRDWNGLSALLDDHVKAFPVRGKPPVSDKPNVMNYLQIDVKNENPTLVVKNRSATGAVVTGTGCWTDIPPVQVNIKFTIVNGLITQMEAPETGNACS
jgi:hypothetical protein